MNLKSKGFTLVELLAVIILIGLIAVITIPKIKDSLDDSKKEIAQASAVNYSKQIDKLVLEEKMKNNSILLDGDYNIDSNGNIYNEENEYTLEFTGETPTGGTLTFIENELQSACITINNYAVTIVNGTVTNTVKGNCEYQNIEDKLQEKIDTYVKAALETNSSLTTETVKTINEITGITENTPDSGWIYFNIENNNLIVADYSLKFGNKNANYESYTNGNYVSSFGQLRSELTHVIIGNEMCFSNQENEECFIIIKSNQEKITLLAKYNLKKTIDNSTNPATITYIQDENNPTKTAFAANMYWVKGDDKNVCTIEFDEKYSNNGQIVVNNNRFNDQDGNDVLLNVYDSNNYTYNYVEGYLAILKENYGLPSTSSGRIITYQEANDLRLISNQYIYTEEYYWTQSINPTCAIVATYVTPQNIYSQMHSGTYAPSTSEHYVRPIIEIPITNLQ